MLFLTPTKKMQTGSYLFKLWEQLGGIAATSTAKYCVIHEQPQRREVVMRFHDFWLMAALGRWCRTTRILRCRDWQLPNLRQVLWFGTKTVQRSKVIPSLTLHIVCHSLQPPPSNSKDFHEPSRRHADSGQSLGPRLVQFLAVMSARSRLLITNWPIAGTPDVSLRCK